MRATRMPETRSLVVITFVVLMVAAVFVSTAEGRQESSDIETWDVVETVDRPVTGEGAEPYVVPSDETLRLISDTYFANREKLVETQLAPSADGTTAQPGAASSAPPEATTVDADEGLLAEGSLEFQGGSTALNFGRNEIHTLVPRGGQFASTLGEPAVANRGRRALYTGNTFASYTNNGGVTWRQRAFPTPPQPGMVMCCDQDVEVSEGRDVVIWNMLWLDQSATNGIVQIAVLDKPNSRPSCWYNIDTSPNAAGVPDYPHLGLSNDFLYLATNNVSGSWDGSSMIRWPLDAIADCAPAARQTFTYGPNVATGQRVFVPVEGATDVMYWGVLGPGSDSVSSMEIFEWPESSTVVTSVSRNISTSVHSDPDCRGGAFDRDYIERPTSWSATGFRMRGWHGQPNGGGGGDVIGFIWNAAPTGSIPQAHIRSAIFDVDTFTLVGQPHIWNGSVCIAYPDVATTDRGHPGLVLAFGGSNGGGGSAANAGVLLGDDTVSGGGPFGPIRAAAFGTENAPNQRFGDYFTVQRHNPAGKYLVAGVYVLIEGATPEHRYIEFGRGRDAAGYERWRLVG